MDGKIVAVETLKGTPPFGSSGVQVKMEMNLVLEGFRPGRYVRLRPNHWPKIKPPREEQIRGLEERWPGPEIFSGR